VAHSARDGRCRATVAAHRTGEGGVRKSRGVTRTAAVLDRRVSPRRRSLDTRAVSSATLGLGHRDFRQPTNPEATPRDSVTDGPQSAWGDVSSTWITTEPRPNRRTMAAHTRAISEASPLVGHHVNMYSRPLDLRPSIHQPNRRPRRMTNGPYVAGAASIGTQSYLTSLHPPRRSRPMRRRKGCAEKARLLPE